MFQLSGFQRDLLYVIAGLDRPSGQDVKEQLEQPYGKEINHGQLYPNLDALVNRGYVEKNQLDQRTNSYALTGRARKDLVRRRRWENSCFDVSDLAATVGLD